MQATKPEPRFEVATDATGIVNHAGASLLAELADRLAFTSALDRRAPAGRCQHPDARVLRDLAVMLADGGDCLSDLATLREQPELFGPVASTPTAWRVIERTATDPDGLARLRLARAHARGRAWAAGADPEVDTLIIDVDATLVTAHTDFKDGVAGTYKGGFGFHPLLTLPGPRAATRRTAGRDPAAGQRRRGRHCRPHRGDRAGVGAAAPA